MNNNYIDGRKMVMVAVNVYETRCHGGAKLDLDSLEFSGERAAALQLLTWLKGVNYAFLNAGNLKKKVMIMSIIEGEGRYQITRECY